MKKIIFILFNIVFYVSLIQSQTCLPDGITFAYQQEIDDFSTNYPGCIEIIGNVTIQEAYTDDITNLNGLLDVEVMGADLVIGNNNALPDLSGLENLTTINGILWIENNNALSGISELSSVQTIDGGIDIINNPSLTDLNGLEGVTSTSDLYVGLNDALNTLNGLDNLTDVSGEAWIEYNDNLTDLTGLGNLNSVGGEFRVNANTGITSLTGLNNLSTVNGTLYIGGNDNLTDISNLSGITSIGGNLWLGYNPVLPNLNGLESLTSIGQGLWIAGNDALSDLAELSSLTDMGGYFLIEYNAGLGSLAGLENLSNIGDMFWLGYNDALTDISSLGNLASIGGDFSIGNNYSMINLNGLEQLSSIPGNFYIGSNYNLTDLSGLDNIASVNGDITLSYNEFLDDINAISGIAPNTITALNIYNNTNLSSCSIQSICNYLDLSNAVTDIHDNNTNCNSEQEIIDNCVCSITATVSNIICDDNGTPSDPNDDTFTFDVEVTGSNTGSSWESSDPNNNTGSYNTLVNFGTYPINGGDLNFIINDIDDTSCSTDVFVPAPATCSDQCDISATVSNITCDDNGTPSDPNDDTFTFDVDVTGTNTGISWVSTDPNNNTGIYDTLVNFGIFLISGGDLSFTISDVDDPDCSVDVFVSAPATCSEQCDISASISNIFCNDNGTPVDSTDDIFSFDLLVTGTNNGNNWIADDTYNSTGVYDELKNMGPYSISEGLLVLTVKDTEDTTCHTIVEIEPPSTCSGTCSIAGSLVQTICNDNKTPSNPEDDIFTIEVLVSGNNDSGTWVDNLGNSGIYDEIKVLGPYKISDGDFVLIFTDSIDNNCTSSLNIVAPEPCSNDCKMSVLISNIDCDDNGTPSISNDDNFNFDITVTGNNTGNSWYSNDPNHNMGSYNVAKNFGKYLIADGDLSFKIKDIKDSTCFVNVFVKAPGTCSGVVCDLEVKQLTIGECDNNNTPDISNDDLFSITLKVSGTGENYIVKTGNQILGSFGYGVEETIGDLPANGSIIDLLIYDKTNTYCDTLINVSKQSCSEGCPVVNIINDIELCNVEENFDLDDLIIESPSGTWNFISGPVTVPLKDGHIIDLDKFPKGKYWFSYILTNPVLGCTEKVLVQISLKEIKSNTIIGKRKICPGEIEILRSQNKFYSYLWNTGETTQSIKIVDEGVYSVTVTDNQNCKRTSSIDVKYWEDLIANDDRYIFSKNDILSMDVFSNDEIEDFNVIQNEIVDSTKKGWLDHLGDSLFYYSIYYPESNYQDTFSYKICHEYCKDMCDIATVNISYNGALALNSEMLLTPNGDGETETLEFKDISKDLAMDYPDNRLVVYNRWGDVVFEKAPYDNDWGGNYNGSILPEGVYYYILQLDQNKKEILYGSILLVK